MVGRQSFTWRLAIGEKCRTALNYKINKPFLRNLRLHDYSVGGRPWGEWKLWTALDTYSILADYFGWEPYRRLIKKYGKMLKKNRKNLFRKLFRYYSMDFDQDASAAAEDKRLDLWARMFSKEVGRNPCPYFSCGFYRQRLGRSVRSSLSGKRDKGRWRDSTTIWYA